MTRTLRVLTVTGLVLSTGVLALVAAMYAVVLFSGCFLSCGDPEPFAGALAAALGLVALGGGGTLVRIVSRTPDPQRVHAAAACTLLLVGLLLSLGLRVGG